MPYYPPPINMNNPNYRYDEAYDPFGEDESGEYWSPAGPTTQPTAWANQPQTSPGQPSPSGGYDYSGYSPYGQPTPKAPTTKPSTQYGQRKPTGSTTTSMPVMPGTPLPTMGTLPKYELPARDEGRVSTLQQKHMYLRPQRRALDQALLSAGREENPAVRKYVTGEALRGFSEGVSGEARRAGSQAEGLYGQERAEEIDVLKTNYSSALQKLAAEYQAQLAQYMAQIGKKQDTEYKYAGQEDSDEGSWYEGQGLFDAWRTRRA